MRRLMAVLAVAATLAVGCSAGGAAPKATATPIRPVSQQAVPEPTVRPVTLAQYSAQRLDWQPCDNGFQCARLLVPFDYARPAWHRFSLPVVKLPAVEPAHRIGTLVINPGGPGGSGIQYAFSARSGEFSPVIRDRFDIVGFDPRGVGASVPALRCMSGPQLDRFIATNDEPASAAQFATVISESKLYAVECARNAAALLPYVGTANAARDMDVLRAALGESALTYLGKSYGTVLGASYAQQFPSRARALVLDGAVDPALSGPQMDIAQAEGFESAFGQFAAWCVTQARCPFGRVSSDAVAKVAVAKVAGLIARANQQPLGSELGTGQPANGAMLLSGIAAALYLRQEWPILSDALTQSFGGDGTVLVELADSLLGRNPNGTYSNMSDVETSVDCVDRPWPRSLASWRAAAAAAAKAAPLFGAAIVWGSLSCAYWPVRSSVPVVFRGRAPGARPILVVGDLHDPATPYQWAVDLSRNLASGILLGWNGEGHTSYMQGSSCVDGTVDAYLISLRLPRDGTVCP